MRKKLTDIEKDIMTHLQYHISKEEKISLTELAEECHVAKSTIVKTAKKIGYSGYVEMLHYMQNRHNEKQARDLAYDLIEGNLNEMIHLLANKINECKDKKNLVVGYGNIDLLSAYLSRKLEMFDIFAPSTYEVNMIQNPRKEKGIAFFCDLREKGVKRRREMLSLAKQEGYYIIAFGDVSNQWIKQYAELYIPLRTTHYKNADFYTAKMLIFFELLLSELALVMNVSLGEQQDGTK